MWEKATFDLSIEYFALRRSDKEDKKAADRICNEMGSKAMLAAVENAAREVVLDMFKKKEYLKRFPNEDNMATALLQNFKLEFLHLPRSISSLASVIANLRGNQLRTIFKGHVLRKKVVEMHEALRLLLNCCFQKLLKAHREGLSWSGHWAIDDWSVIDEDVVDFEGAPVMYDDQEELLAACKLDLQKFATVIVWRFAIGHSYPAYLLHFSNELSNQVHGMTYQDYFGSEEDRDSFVYFSGQGWYYEYLEFHPALMTAFARLALIEGWYICINGLQYEKWPEFKATLCSYLDWVEHISLESEDQVDKIVWLTFWYNSDKIVVAGSKTLKTLYVDTWAQKHLFLRQLCIHTYWHTKLSGDVQTIREEDEPEVNAARLEPTFLPDFVKHLLRSRKMILGLFRFWDAYRKQRG